MRYAAVFVAALSVSTVVQADWLSDANARIAAHRMGDLQVKVVDQSGKAVNGATVSVRQTESAFHWGTAVNSDYYAAAAPDANTAIYKAKIDQLFNQAVLENGHKWKPWENTPQKNRANTTVNALLAQDKRLRGHTMVWAREESLPTDLNAAVTNKDVQTIRSRTLNHINAIGTANRGKVAEWDVVNEHWANHVLTDVVDPTAPIEQAPLLAEWYRAAQTAAPDATLYINDYSILASGNQTNTSHQKSLYDTVAYLKSQNAPVGGIGFQSHFGSAGARTSGENLVKILDRFAALGTELQVTEFDMYGTGWTEQSKADYLREFMTAVFSHDAVTGFNMWGFWDGQHFMNSAPLFDQNWNLKLSGEVFMDLVFDQWRTTETGTTAAGLYNTRAFLGDYAIDVTMNGATKSYTTSVDAAGRTLTVVVPEPTMLGLVGISTIAMLRRRRIST